ncbi:MAG: hypothetical protein H6742_00330 [Alphaproteobacteria bacterium]|nr:hypothetical protein [Alphaproteobacteria bacterium]
MILFLLLACGGAEPDVDPLAPWPADPDALAAHCATLPYPQLVTTCRVQAAARFATADRVPDAEAQCDAVPDGAWRDECHFRVGEELGVAGNIAAAARHCGQAGWFARNCVTHAAWRMRLPEGTGPTSDVAALQAEGSELLSVVEAGLSAHEDGGLVGEGRQAFLAAWGLHVYLGSGRTDPAPAQLSGEVGAALRTGLMTEAARLLPDLSGDPVARLVEVAAGREVLVGEALPRGLDGAGEGVAARGRWHLPVLLPHDAGLPHLPLYGGGLRLVGEDRDEDAVIAALEALYWREDSGVGLFLPYVADPRPRVRWTAVKAAALVARGDPETWAAVQAAVDGAAADAESAAIVAAVGRR